MYLINHTNAFNPPKSALRRAMSQTTKHKLKEEMTEEPD